MEKEIKLEYGGIAQSIAPMGIVMACFSLVYSIWFGFAWGEIGWLVFTVIILCNFYIVVKSIKNIQHANQFEAHETADGLRITKQMGILSGTSYSVIWILVFILFFSKQERIIFPMVTLIIGLHFLPQAKIMRRKIDYFVAPFPIFSAGLALYLAFNSDINWIFLGAVAGIGGSIATTIYGFYLLAVYKKIANKFNIPY
ncbi:MAG: hypothetical protein Q4A27_01315 [bacterium]|nr:hypothetical protein [bacterium]MDO4872053.1 hypothetical protein [bacterium]